MRNVLKLLQKNNFLIKKNPSTKFSFQGSGRDFCEPDSEMLTNDTNNQVARGIQSKSVHGMEAETPVGGVKGEAPLNFFFKYFFLIMRNMQKKNYQNQSNIFFALILITYLYFFCICFRRF